MSLADLRREYNLTGLRRADLDPDPMAQFKRWFDQATGLRASGWLRKLMIRVYKTLRLIPSVEPMDVSAMTLATADKEGRPSARVVLLKGIDSRGFIFFTNYNSRKGRELSENPNATLVSYWSDLERQVCVSGKAEKLSPEESDAYFKTRPKGSRIAAWASDQSTAIKDRATLEARWEHFQSLYPSDQVPRPPHWGGYVLNPIRVEFWQGRANRLHDRFAYSRQSDGAWRIERLAP